MPNTKLNYASMVATRAQNPGCIPHDHCQWPYPPNKLFLFIQDLHVNSWFCYAIQALFFVQTIIRKFTPHTPKQPIVDDWTLSPTSKLLSKCHLLYQQEIVIAHPITSYSMGNKQHVAGKTEQICTQNYFLRFHEAIVHIWSKHFAQPWLVLPSNLAPIIF